MIVVLMGVAGSGKTTIGERLAATLNWLFVDADSFHSAGNVAKMQAGLALTDEDRAPWLAAIAQAMGRWLRDGRNVVLACSALKQAYRDVLAGGSTEVRWVVLRGAPALITQRLARRKGHFMPASLLASQLAALEVPTNAVIVEVDAAPAEVVSAIRQGLSLS
jgi:gluconokinase